MTLSTKSTTTSELPLRCCTTTLTMAYHHSHSRMLYLLPLLFLLLPHPCITAASWIIASLDYHCLFGPQPLFGLPRYFWITAVSTYQTKQSVTPISAFFHKKLFPIEGNGGWGPCIFPLSEISIRISYRLTIIVIWEYIEKREIHYMNSDISGK